MVKDGSPVQGQQPPVQGALPYDPSQNVMNLVTAAIQRQDDLRHAEARHVREIMSAEGRRQDEMASLRAVHAREMRQAETDRINAIRAVDVGAVESARKVQQAQADTLAAQVAATAEAFRVSLAAALAPIETSIADLRRAQYEAQGSRTQVVEARDVRGESRLNQGQIIAYAGLILVILGLILAYASKP